MNIFSYSSDDPVVCVLSSGSFLFLRKKYLYLLLIEIPLFARGTSARDKRDINYNIRLKNAI